MSSTNDQQSPQGAGVLVDDHAQVGDLILELLAALDQGNKVLSFERLDLLWARLAVHIRAEHLCLFPVILSMAHKPSGVSPAGAPPREQVREVLERLREDHDFFMVELARAVRVAREMFTPGATPSAGQFSEIKRRVLAVGDRLVEHNRLEEEQVYRWPEILLSSAERDELNARMKREIENLPPRFSTGNGSRSLIPL